MERRDVLRFGLMGALASALPLFASGPAQAASQAAWKVSFHHAHTGESFNGVYRVGDKYLPEAFERINYILRDFRTGEAFPMDPRVLDIASRIQAKMGLSTPFEVLSGYRSPKTNAMLRRVSTGVAKNSFHMYGQAMDLRVAGRTRKLRDTAKSLRAGGVGYYPKSGFVHVDTGNIRTW
ncbi:MAG: DUF882 domain-containing protein [Alphaproteobacteria bacterium]|nr:DUF882 domain-containing protein [Alphaproteobacteria bacterium]